MDLKPAGLETGRYVGGNPGKQVEAGTNPAALRMAGSRERQELSELGVW